MSQIYHIDYSIKIKDNGCGISPQGIDQLFKDYSMLQENASQNFTGTGLGLSICKKLINQMQGAISVESELGEGTTFIVKLQNLYVEQRGSPLNRQSNLSYSYIDSDNESSLDGINKSVKSFKVNHDIRHRSIPQTLLSQNQFD